MPPQPRSLKVTPYQAGRALANSGFMSSGRNQMILATAIAVGWAESKFDILAQHVNSDGSTDYGFMQVNSVHGYPVSQLLTLQGNADAAFDVWNQAGRSFKPWTTYKSGAYIPYLATAMHVANEVAKDIKTNAPNVPLPPDEYGPNNPDGFGGGLGEPFLEAAATPFNIAGNVVEDVKGAVDVALAPAKLAAAVLSFLVHRNGFMRVLEVFFGVMFLLAGIAIVLRNLDAPNPFGKVPLVKHIPGVS